MFKGTDLREKIWIDRLYHNIKHKNIKIIEKLLNRRKITCTIIHCSSFEMKLRFGMSSEETSVEELLKSWKGLLFF